MQQKKKQLKNKPQVLIFKTIVAYGMRFFV